HTTARNLLAAQRQELDANCRRLAAELALAVRNVEACTIHVPFDGRIDELKVQAGDWVRPGDFLLSMLDPQRLVVTVEVPVSRSERVVRHDRVTLFREARADIGWTGVVGEIAAAANASRQTLDVYVDVDNANTPPQAWLKDGF